VNRIVFAIAGVLAIARPAWADTDLQAWAGLTATHQIGERIGFTFDGQIRTSDEVSRVGQYLLRPSLGYKLGATTVVSLGYAYFHTDPLGPAEFDEHRLWEQLSYRLAGDGAGVTVTGRTRLEQRWREGSSEMGQRLRQQVRVTAPLNGPIRAVAWSEAFVALDDTTWGQRSGLDRWRNALAVSIPLNESTTIEPGYINQWVNRSSNDSINHIANVTLNVKF